MPGWQSYTELLRDEFTQLREEGRDLRAIAELEEALSQMIDSEEGLEDHWSQIQAVPSFSNFKFYEPNNLNDIRRLRIDTERELKIPNDESWLYDRLYGAWLGRCIGCALGKPVEGFMESQNGISSKDRIKRYLEAISPSEYPLNYYFPIHSPAEDIVGKVDCAPSTREYIKFMETDDDIRYTVLGQMILQGTGQDFTPWDVAATWIFRLPYGFVCTAETQAYRNLVIKYDFHAGAQWLNGPQEIDCDWTSTFLNPYREWIGAQIRADSYGYAAPGKPELAAEFAWRDARLTHVKNGIYGEMFVSAMIAAAFALEDPLDIVEAGLAEIPKTSRLYSDLRKVIGICKKYNLEYNKFEEVLEEIYTLVGHYHPVHTISNAALVVAALILGRGNFERVVTLAVMGGWDTDCNGATAGSIVGVMAGASKIPKKWKDPLNDTLYSGLADYHPIAISECAKRSIAIVKKIKKGARRGR